jgi:UDP-glucuronate decarboxylase
MKEDDGRAVSNFIMQALQSHDVTIYGDGQHTRSMLYVDDLVEGLLCLMDSDDVAFAPVNLGNPHEITILELARRVVELTGSESEVVHLPEAIDDPHVRCPDISRSRALLGWEPTIALDDGLRATIDYFARRLAGPRPRRDRQHSTPIAAATARLAA